MTTRRWVGWVNVIFGAWLITSPWLLSLAADNRAAAWNSWGVGTWIVMLGLFSIYKPALWGDVVGILFGAWLIASPWMLGFASASVGTANAIIIGLLVIGYALWAMRIDVTSGHGTSGGSAAPVAYRRQLKQQSAQAVVGRTRA